MHLRRCLCGFAFWLLECDLYVLYRRINTCAQPFHLCRSYIFVVLIFLFFLLFVHIHLLFLDLCIFSIDAICNLSCSTAVEVILVFLHLWVKVFRLARVLL